MVRRVRIIVMRHLPTLGNQQKQYIGWTDEPIVVVDHLNWKLSWYPAVVYGSDLLRAGQSAALYFPQAVYKSDFRFRESHFGEWEGKTYDLLKKDKRYRSWIDDPHTYAPPGGERLCDTENRVLAAFSELPVDKEDAFVVTHGGPIRLLLTRYSPDKQSFWSWIIPHGSIWVFEWETFDDWREGKRCASISAVPTMVNEFL